MSRVRPMAAANTHAHRPTHTHTRGHSPEPAQGSHLFKGQSHRKWRKSAYRQLNIVTDRERKQRCTGSGDVTSADNIRQACQRGHTTGRLTSSPARAFFSHADSEDKEAADAARLAEQNLTDITAIPEALEVKLRHTTAQATAWPAEAVTVSGLKSVLQAVRELCRRIHGYIARQGRDRFRPEGVVLGPGNRGRRTHV
jgi:hypothetical protein